MVKWSPLGKKEEKGEPPSVLMCVLVVCVLQRTSLLSVAELGSFPSATLRRRMTGKNRYSAVIH